MYQYDALGSRNKDRDVLAQVMLAQANDPELNDIVKKAASDLNAPIALVTLVLEHVQLFQAHFGLPGDLAAARATERNVSFCQFVVRDGEPFEVIDASADDRIPQALVERYGIQSYLGIPLRVQDVVVGSLCVLDTKARGFDDQQRADLGDLAQLVAARLENLAEQRRITKRSLSPGALVPGLVELSASLVNNRSRCSEAQIAAATVESCLRMLAYSQAGGTASSGAVEGALRGAIQSMDELNDALVELECSNHEAAECVVAIETLLSTKTSARLSDVMHAAQDLSRGPCRVVGNAPMPDFVSDPLLATGSAQSVSVLASGLIYLAERMSELGLFDGLRIGVEELDSAVRISLSSAQLGIREYGGAMQALGDQLDPALVVEATDAALCVSIATFSSTDG
jgi:hypothetical protein